MHEAGALALACAVALLVVLSAWTGNAPSASAPTNLIPVALGFAAVRLIVASLLLGGVLRSLRGDVVEIRAGITLVLAPTIMLFVAIGVVLGMGADNSPVTSDLGIAGQDVLTVVQVADAVMFTLAAIAYRSRFRSSGRVLDQATASALLFLALADAYTLITGTGTPSPTGATALRLVGAVLAFSGATIQLAFEMRWIRRSRKAMGAQRAQEIQSTVLSQRNRAGGEIYDRVTEDLAAARLWLTVLRRSLPDTGPTESLVSQIDIALRRASDDMAAAFAPTLPYPTSSIAAQLRSHIEDFTQRYGIPVAFRAVDVQDCNPAVAREIAMIASQALHNAGLHASAAGVVVTLEPRDGALRLEVADDGRGFDWSRDRPDHYGIEAMRERATLVGAVVDIVSAPEAGTRIVLTLPDAHLRGPSMGRGYAEID